MNGNATEPGLGSLISSFSGTLGRQILSVVLQLTAIIVIARTFGPTGNGTYAVAILLPTSLSILLNFGISSAHVYYLGSQQVNLKTVLSSNLILGSILSLTGLLVGAACILVKGDEWFPNINPGLLWLALTILPASILHGFVTSIFQGLQKFREFNYVLLAQSFCYLILVCALALIEIRELYLLIISYLISILCSLTLAFLLISKLQKNNHQNTTRKYIREALVYGYKVHLSNILAFINYKADIFLINFLVNPAATGIYVIAVQLGERLWLISQSASTVLLPRLSSLRNNENARLKLTPLITRLVFMVSMVAGLILAFAGYPLISFLFGEAFSGAYAPLLILIPGILATSASRILANDFAARGRPELNIYTAAFVIVINIAGNIALIPVFGIEGAATATSFAYICNLLLRSAIYCKITKTTFWALLLPRKADVYRLLKAPEADNA